MLARLTKLIVLQDVCSALRGVFSFAEFVAEFIRSVKTRIVSVAQSKPDR